MIKIEAINLPRLRNNEHAQFMTDFDTLVKKHNATLLGIDSEYPAFSLGLSSVTAMRVEQGSIKSKHIEHLDQLRDRTWYAIYTKVKASLHSPFEDEVNSAEVILRIMDTYGNIRDLSYNEASAVMSKLLTSLMKSDNAIHLQKVGVTSWVAEMKKENDDFQANINERNTEYAGRENGNIREARKEVDPLYERMVEKINASIVLGVANEAATSFAGELNEKINYYKITIAARSGRSKDNAHEM